MEVLDRFIFDSNIIVTAAPGNGATSFIQMIINSIALKKNVLYYDPSGTINREFTTKYYSNIASNVCFLSGSFHIFIDYIIDLGSNFNYIVVDPGDILSNQQESLRLLSLILSNTESKLICTSQIRIDPTTGKPYSTLERVTKINRLDFFDYSIWIRNVTESNPIYTNRYVDIYNNFRVTKNFVHRYIVQYTKEGNINE